MRARTWVHTFQENYRSALPAHSAKINPIVGLFEDFVVFQRIFDIAGIVLDDPSSVIYCRGFLVIRAVVFD